MDPENLPADERSQSARLFPCPYCGVEAGIRCRTASGEYYTEWAYVHIDRLITMYRDAFVNHSERQGDSWAAGYRHGLERGWVDGALDARYTFDNTPIRRGAREEDLLGGAMEEAGVVRAQNEAEADPSSSQDVEPPLLRIVPPEVT